MYCMRKKIKEKEAEKWRSMLGVHDMYKIPTDEEREREREREGKSNRKGGYIRQGRYGAETESWRHDVTGRHGRGG